MLHEMFSHHLMTPPFQEGSALIFWGVCGASVLLMAIAKSGFGGAVASLSAPLMLTILPARETLAILLPLYLLTDIWAIWIWRGYSYWRVLLWMVVFGVVGQVFGYLLISVINDAMLKALIGLIALIIGGRYWYRVKSPTILSNPRQKARHLRGRLKSRAAIWCGLSGFSSFISLTGGIPVQVYLLPMKMHRFLVVGTSAWYFFSINVAKLPFFFQLGMFTSSTLFVTVVLIPIIPLGVSIGKWLNRRMTDKGFYHIAHIALILLGCRLIWGVVMS
jgi:uncharacterized membrane protein YfcA